MISLKINLCTHHLIQQHQKKNELLCNQKWTRNGSTQNWSITTTRQTITGIIKSIKNNSQYELEAEAQLRDLEQLSQDLTSKIEGEIILRKEKENQLVGLMEKKLRMLKN
jgi:hypothetical protein